MRDTVDEYDRQHLILSVSGVIFAGTAVISRFNLRGETIDAKSSEQSEGKDVI